MAILVDRNTRVITQGITGAAGSFHTKQCIAYGTNVVGGVVPVPVPGSVGGTIVGLPL